LLRRRLTAIFRRAARRLLSRGSDTAVSVAMRLSLGAEAVGWRSLRLDLGHIADRRRRVELPASFYVGGSIGGLAGWRSWGGGGRVEVGHDHLSFQPDRLLRRLADTQRITHDSTRVTMVRARLLPPGFRTAILISGHGRFVRVLAWYGRSYALLAAIRAVRH
jgi:hypothetical protein